MPQPSARKDRWKSPPSLHLLYSSRHLPRPLRVGFTPPSDESDGVLTRAGKQKFSAVTLSYFFVAPRLDPGMAYDNRRLFQTSFICPFGKCHEIFTVDSDKTQVRYSSSALEPVADTRVSPKGDNLASCTLVFTAASTHGGKNGSEIR